MTETALLKRMLLDEDAFKDRFCTILEQKGVTWCDYKYDSHKTIARFNKGFEMNGKQLDTDIKAYEKTFVERITTIVDEIITKSQDKTVYIKYCCRYKDMKQEDIWIYVINCCFLYKDEKLDKESEKS